MKYFIVKDQGKYHRIGSSCTPKGYEEIYQCPSDVENAEDIKIVEVEQMGTIIKEVQLDEVKRDARLAAEAAKLAANEYKGNRQREYPAIAEQLDMIYWDKENGTDEWYQLIKSIKEIYPKGS